ncbi:phosphatidate cytidylyltransferase [Mycolicibacterium parafortuitum]|uniref:Phosphatidate cytidylyltransferase n=1 Tax=Mycolicibacterium parafortuitum TaxID=39692 RepID=A0A375YJI4_MYCPF|nr:phosphatidate cytidylyltransferase [Mycolicibacterium parafortuitum]ORB32569.1 phosphatidate cytidylyltransferase [Mycolicibacterium parafortuitum]SRX81305.1 putative integral membrane phosphatidate cytidylyltransferase CdsA (CDP-diglyceride synthetase) (CDP-diglyceride pyrophosphorylase) (CDP-diacylglycerol synthase) (CDS) (CTP:phosphatidate cytidylyltransferase) (CDP-DAG synthase) (CDP-DG synthetase) [Mycobacterium tuberculosis H37Rv] [Mycolicibacterium parafortuitum]
MTDQHSTPVEAKPVDEPPKKSSRAGRDLPAAIAVGVALGGGLIAILLFAPYLWLALVAAAVAIATFEVCSRLGEAGYRIPMIPLLVGGQATLWLTWPFGPTGALGAFAATVVVCMIWRLVGQGLNHTPQNYTRDISATVFVATWVPLFASFGALLIYPDDGANRVFCLMLGVVFSDIGGYVAGVLFGKHTMAPAISPKKSWEGLAGSLLFGVTASVVAVVFLLDKPWWAGVALGLMLVLTGTLGDLVESQFKRDLGIKDMSNLLPGHGGMMDRIDAMLPSAVATWIVLTLLA